MTRDGFSCFLGIQNFPGEDPPPPPPDPPSRLENMCFIFQFNTAQHKPLIRKEDL